MDGERGAIADVHRTHAYLSPLERLSVALLGLDEQSQVFIRAREAQQQHRIVGENRERLSIGLPLTVTVAGPAMGLPEKQVRVELCR